MLDDGRVRVALPDPKDLGENFVNSGVPHAIVPVEDLAGTDVDGEGRRIRWSQAFQSAGANVDFVRWTGQSSLDIRIRDGAHIRGITLTGPVSTVFCGEIDVPTA